MEMTNTKGERGLVARWGGAALLGAALTLTGCNPTDVAKAPSPPPPEVDVATVLAEPVTVTETFTGRIEAPETVRLRPRVSGYIQEVTFEEGELVEAGDVLFRIDPRPYEARVAAARADLAHARSVLQLAASEADRASSLVERQAISREDYERRQAARSGARARVDEAQAALETAELDLEYTRVTAPVGGRAGRAMITKGNLASANDTVLTTVVSVNPLHVFFESNEAAAVSGQALPDGGAATTLHIGLAGENGFPHKGTLDFVDNRLNADTGTLQFRAVLANPRGVLKPGQFARVEMPVSRLDRALLVNRKAVLTDQDRRFVYVVDGDNTVARQRVTTGPQLDDLLVIRDGLDGGDRVIVNGTQKIFGAGMEVKPNGVAMREGSPRQNPAVAMNQP